MSGNWQGRGGPQGPRPGGPGGHGGAAPAVISFRLSDEDVKGILGKDGKVIADAAKKLAESLQTLERAQIRNFYGPMTRIGESSAPDADRLNELHLMRPRLVYMAAREKRAQPLQDAFDKLITSAGPEGVKGICLFAEAVVGYHRLYKS